MVGVPLFAGLHVRTADTPTPRERRAWAETRTEMERLALRSVGSTRGSGAHRPRRLASGVQLPSSSGERPRMVARKAIGDWPVRWWKNLLKLVALLKPSCAATRAAD